MSKSLTRRKKVSYLPFIGIDNRYLAFLKPYWFLLFFSFLLIVIVAALEAAAPWPLKIIVDNVLKGEVITGEVGDFLHAQLGTDPRILAVFLGLALLLVTFLQGFASFTYEYLDGIIKERAAVNLQSTAFEHMQKLSLYFFYRKRHGGILKRVTDDASRLMIGLVGSLGDFILNAVRFTSFSVIMFMINPRFSFIVLAYVPLLFYLFVSFRRKIRSTAKEARMYEGEMMDLALETLGAIREIKAFGQEVGQRKRFEKKGRKRLQAGLRALRWDASFNPLIDLIQAFSTVAVLWFGVSQVLTNQLTIGELLVFLAYMKSLYRPLRKFSRLAAEVQKAAAGGDRLSRLLDTKDEIRESRHPLSLERAHGAVHFKNVNFSYPGSPDTEVIQDFNLKVVPGQVVALVGHTGAGKTTIANLLMRFYDLSGGEILIDGLNIRKLRLSDLRRQFAIVPQEPVLFAASIRENIVFGRPGAEEREIKEAAQLANAEEFIDRLYLDYDTMVGERGAMLSGGQRQRIAIARALLRDAPLLILDEPTAALDAGSEKMVMDALGRLLKGRTTFIIAHRLSTILNADHIVVMDQGRIIEHGTHAELMKNNGSYTQMVALQLAPSEEDPPITSRISQLNAA